ncbi:2-hydroxy-3-keto-5-methylthiopentenyl-1-phosphate phosphatase [Paenisporosarcina antarctica]|uniref:2-hydroxy-3-keto-5-methylthiopentenyl-1-phosphate phosphatase n=1 Tax=Paenisporosarcina antarctica TaxID=417367 RepID=A0A4P7A058_9BACL|nr:2-hydroxy-3-keto-5-methylthiopentenyl-1-phosphate phosphatase [Paenisporosarcina antarctica]QBP41216.1 2-hydroxy-3-keto-5-methylthiopentenyl-1-phosphate phosphatase [Paenisporosarcina antarctica]
MKNLTIFCDFDGTITTQDNIIHIMKKFNPPEWESIKDNILAQNISIEEGVRKMFSLLPSSLKDEVISYVLKEAQIREGFGSFVVFTKKYNIQLYIVSGGIDFFVKPLLEPYGPFEDIYCNIADFSEDTIKIIFPFGCDETCPSQGCGCCKPSIMRNRLPKDATSIVIGDSITDLEAAKLADIVIARDFLVEKCEELRLPYEKYESFHDVITIIETRLGVKS